VCGAVTFCHLKSKIESPFSSSFSISFRASWCKACHRFAPKLRHIVQTYGEPYEDALHHNHAMTHNSHLGLVRFADVEFHENEHLCHVLDVERMPCVHLYSKSKLVQSIHHKNHMHTKVTEALQQQLGLDVNKSTVMEESALVSN
jgi:thiol-disulfide isomerase/thioredoxin